jgi:putative transposase
MGRIARTSMPDGYFHVYARGVAGTRIFGDDSDRDAFVQLVTHCEQRHGWVCHAFTLLHTHYHLVLKSKREHLSVGVQQLNGRYSRRFNKRHGRFGHVFAERFSARVIQSEEYLYDACEYVLLNPVRAGLCQHAEDWPWSFSLFAA